jgi:hypothetical protein
VNLILRKSFFKIFYIVSGVSIIWSEDDSYWYGTNDFKLKFCDCGLFWSFIVFYGYNSSNIFLDIRGSSPDSPDKGPELLK